MKSRSTFRAGAAATSYAIILGAVALAGVAGLATVGSHQGAISGDVADALSTNADAAVKPNSNSGKTVPDVSPVKPVTPENKGNSGQQEEVEKEKVLFSETFRDPSSLKEWDVLGDSLWKVADGSLVNGQMDGWKPNQQVFAPGGPWGNQAIEVNVTMNSGWGYGIYVRSEIDKHGRPSGVCFQVDPGYRPGAFLFREVKNGKEGAAQSVTWAPGFDFYGEAHKVRVEAVGDVYTAYVDGRKVAEFTSKKFDEGTAGLRTWGHGSGEVAFHDIKVTEPIDPSQDDDKYKNKKGKNA